VNIVSSRGQNNFGNMTFDICGKNGARVRYVTKSYGKGANLLVIQNNPDGQLPALRSRLFHGRNFARDRTHQITSQKICARTESRVCRLRRNRKLIFNSPI
jgi:hypothetical protein